MEVSRINQGLHRLVPNQLAGLNGSMTQFPQQTATDGVRAKGHVSLHGHGGISPVPIEVHEAGVGEEPRERGHQQERCAGTLDPDVPFEAVGQPFEEPAVVPGQRVASPRTHCRNQFVPQGFGVVGEVGQRDAHDRGNVLRPESGAGAEPVEVIAPDQIVPEHKPDPRGHAAETPEQGLAAHATAHQGLLAHPRQELRNTEHARVQVHDVRQHRRPAPPRAHDEHRSRHCTIAGVAVIHRARCQQSGSP